MLPHSAGSRTERLQIRLPDVDLVEDDVRILTLISGQFVADRETRDDEKRFQQHTCSTGTRTPSQVR